MIFFKHDYVVSSYLSTAVWGGVPIPIYKDMFCKWASSFIYLFIDASYFYLLLNSYKMYHTLIKYLNCCIYFEFQWPVNPEHNTNKFQLLHVDQREPLKITKICEHHKIWHNQGRNKSSILFKLNRMFKGILLSHFQ